MTRRVILHIGPAKTGTSSLQEALFAARDQLLAQGILYPSFGRHRFMPKLPGHHGIPALLRRTGEMPEDVLAGLAELDPELTVLLSSEDFSLMEKPAIEAFVAALGPAQIEPVYYARRWDHLLPSIWQELIKHGHSWPYLEFLNGQVSAPRASHYLNFALPIRRWTDAVGKTNLRLFSYDNVTASGQDIVSHFCTDVLGMSLIQEATQHVNPRWPAERVEILRMLNWLTFGKKKPDATVRTRLVSRQDDIAAELDALDSMMRPYVRRARPCAPMVQHSIQNALMREFGDQVGNPCEDGLFNKRAFDEAAYLRADYLIETQAPERLRALHGTLMPGTVETL